VKRIGLIIILTGLAIMCAELLFDYPSGTNAQMSVHETEYMYKYLFSKPYQQKLIFEGELDVEIYKQENIKRYEEFLNDRGEKPDPYLKDHAKNVKIMKFTPEKRGIFLFVYSGNITDLSFSEHINEFIEKDILRDALIIVIIGVVIVGIEMVKRIRKV